MKFGMKIRPFTVVAIPIAFGAALGRAMTLARQVREIASSTGPTPSTGGDDKMAEPGKNLEREKPITNWLAPGVIAATRAVSWHTL